MSETRIPGHRVTRVDREKVAFQSVVVAKLDGLVITMYMRREKERESLLGPLLRTRDVQQQCPGASKPVES